jgi:hypothetical protein
LTKDRAVWAEVVKELMYCVPPNDRAAILALATEHEVQQRRKIVKLDDESFKRHAASPSFQYRDEIVLAMSRVITVFVRDIFVNHSREDAAAILFREFHDAGWLPHMLDELPYVDVDLEGAAELEPELVGGYKRPS